MTSVADLNAQITRERMQQAATATGASGRSTRSRKPIGKPAAPVTAPAAPVTAPAAPVTEAARQRTESSTAPQMSR
jgi:hypothetical protein